MESIFNEQLGHCGVDYFDYYLLHNMGTNVYEKCRKYDAFCFAAKKKEEGKIRYLGMSPASPDQRVFEGCGGEV